MAKRTNIIAPGITMQWDVMSGTPCIVGSRLSTEWIASRFLFGNSVRALANDYEKSPEHIEAAIRYEFNLKKQRKRRPRAHKPE